jgi:hypothetical protein
MVVHFCNLNYVGSINRRTVLPGQSGQKVRPYLKITKAKSAGGVAQVVDLPPSKCKAMSSNPSTEKKKRDGAKGQNMVMPTFNPSYWGGGGRRIMV